MVLMEAVLLSGGAVFVGLQLFDRTRGVKKPLRILSNQPSLADRLATGAKKGEVVVDGDMVETIAKNSAIIAGTVATSIIHIQTGSSLLLLNGAGYIVLLVAYYLPPLSAYQHITRDLFISYTAVTFGSYFVVNGAASLINRSGLFAKLIEAGLLTILWIEREEDNKVLVIDQQPQPA